MKKIFENNGLVVWDEQEVIKRNQSIETISLSLKDFLLQENRGWLFYRIESTNLIPTELVNKEYSTDDYFNLGELSLRPETTVGSYAYAEMLMNEVMPPLVVWQAGKSFRKETDQVTKHMRLKEFYQLEFQCIYSEGTLNDYHSKVLPVLKEVLSKLTGKESRIVESDRLPSYSLKTFDIEVLSDDYWMEICSVSLRNDFEKEFKDKKCLVLEIAVGLDRIIYQFNQ